jgi:hypothetical protein
MPSVCIVELNVTVSYIKILTVAQQCFYGEFTSSATIKRSRFHLKGLTLFKKNVRLLAHGLL